MDLNELYQKLNKIFIDHTTHQWKNGWQHEGDRLSKELTIQNNVKNNNLFLLVRRINEILLDGPGRFKLQILKIRSNSEIRIDIEGGENVDINIHYHVDNQSDWISHSEFIVELCRNIYNANVLIRESISEVPKNLHGTRNPKFVNYYFREKKLGELLSES